MKLIHTKWSYPQKIPHLDVIASILKRTLSEMIKQHVCNWTVKSRASIWVLSSILQGKYDLNRPALYVLLRPPANLFLPSLPSFLLAATNMQMFRISNSPSDGMDSPSLICVSPSCLCHITLPVLGAGGEASLHPGEPPPSHRSSAAPHPVTHSKAKGKGAAAPSCYSCKKPTVDAFSAFQSLQQR